MVSQPLSTSISSDSNPIAYCFAFLCGPVLRTIFECASWVIFSVAAIAVVRWPNWCLHYSYLSAGGALDEAPVIRLHSNPIARGWGACGAMTCSCGMLRKIITKRNGKSWGIYRYLQVQMKWVTANFHLLFKLNPAAYSCKLQGIPRVPQFAVSRSDVVHLLTGISCSEQQLISLVW